MNLGEHVLHATDNRELSAPALPSGPVGGDVSRARAHARVGRRENPQIVPIAPAELVEATLAEIPILANTRLANQLVDALLEAHRHTSMDEQPVTSVATGDEPHATA